jgi:hypothetical protein
LSALEGLKRRGELAGVVAHHGEIGCGGTLRTRQGVRIQRPTDDDAGVLGNAFENTVVADVLDEETGDVLALDLVDQGVFMPSGARKTMP